MHDTTARSRTLRRRTAVVGLFLGALLGMAFVAGTGGAVSQQRTGVARAVLDATHVPPLLTRSGDDVALRYDVHCASALEGVEDQACSTGGTVFVRAGGAGAFRGIALSVDPAASEGRLLARIPESIASSRLGFSYYAVLIARVGAGSDEATVTLPAGGAASPHRSLPLGPAVEVSLGRHEFGQTRGADERVAEAGWGSGAAEAGLEGGTNVAPAGGSSFDVDAGRGVLVLDQVKRRVLRWAPGASAPSVRPLPIDGTIADLSVARDGTMYVLEGARAGRGPVLRTLDPSGTALGVTELGERTATQVRVGSTGALVLQHPSGQWLPVAGSDSSQAPAAQEGPGLAGRVFSTGDEVVVLRTGNEIRLALTRRGHVRQSWRVTSTTRLAEVQLAEPMGDGLLVVARVYTDADDEFVALVLGRRGLLRALSLDSADWAESAPLSRFRLVGSSLYQLGSTREGLFVDRFDLEVKR
jgi:hypothetical protein